MTLYPMLLVILNKRIEPTERTPVDVSDLLASAFGKALHSATEYAWSDATRVAEALTVLGFDKHVISNVRINPDPSTVNEYTIPIYIEKRISRVIDGVTITGKYDLVSEGLLQDYKSTSAYSWVHGSNDTNHAMQGSIYRWLDAGQEYPVIHEDYININYLFTDWQKSTAMSNPDYPQQRVAQKAIPLMSVEDTENWIRNRIKTIQYSSNLSDSELPECTEEELWFSKKVYKYFSDPTKVGGRSTRTFNDIISAQQYMVSKSGKGIITESSSEPKRCGYCSAANICTQRLKYFPTL